MKIFLIAAAAFLALNYWAFKPMIVLSSSMEPAIKIGDLVFAKKESKYGLGDTVTFKDKNGRKVTHRIVKIEQDEFFTKGDANKSQDAEKINDSQIIGKVVLVIPKAGYLISFIQNPQVFVPLVFGLAIIIVINQCLKIYSQIRQ